MRVQSLQEKKELVAVYNELCCTLLDVQVTLSQNKPQSMTAQDQSFAAARFQNSMQVPIRSRFRIYRNVNSTCQTVPHMCMPCLCDVVSGARLLCCASM